LTSNVVVVEFGPNPPTLDVVTKDEKAPVEHWGLVLMPSAWVMPSSPEQIKNPTADEFVVLQWPLLGHTSLRVHHYGPGTADHFKFQWPLDGHS
jgi:hypothetical protein